MNIYIFIACIAAAIVLLLFTAAFIKPLKRFLILILNSVAGWIGLYIFNKIFTFASFSIGINIASASIAGILGLPGLLMMIALKLIYGV